MPVSVLGGSKDLGLVRGLGLLAATAIVIGDVIGTGVFLKTRVMTCNVGSPALVVTVWVVAGLLCLAGALTYAELSAMMPRAGGEYVFIRRAYGSLTGFLYGWTRFFVASTGGIAGLAAGFAIFINVLAGGALQADALTLNLFGYRAALNGQSAIAVLAIVIVTILNCTTVAVGGRIAFILTVFKIALVLAIGAGAMFLADGTWTHFAMANDGGACDGVAAAARGGAAGFGAAMLGALWAYNGWNEVTYVAEEVKDPQRNLPLALIGGLGVIATLYIFVNVAYFYVLTPTEIANIPESSAVATEVISRVVGAGAATAMAGVLAMSIFGALQIATLVCARIPYAMARDGMFFSGLGTVSPRTHVPVRALLVQGVWSVILVLSGSFDVLTDYAVFSVLIFVALGTASVFIFRRQVPAGERTYRTWGYPLVPMAFLLVTGWLLINTLQTTPGRAISGLALMAVGLPFYWYWSRTAPGPGRGV